ncbi:type VI secretion system-associated FHA domain protein TagH [Mangrovitalea sediminis]|uniref:type VI secretion system-associated FHA domain protein TagH n=1 Tax=Mangrovitalea sediminis TaxID=1982043 RepID=UPI001304235F|nr:type VI secretion system-associated FHA domain protein TagH [Mangrovitalea sediminis]
MWIRVTVTEAPAGTGMAGQSISVDAAGATLGRSPANSLVLPDPDRYVSSTHARIEFDGQRFLLYDDSTNGTFINGSPQALGAIAPHILVPGDQIRCGDYLLTVASDTALQPAAAPQKSVQPSQSPSSAPAFGPEPSSGDIDYDELDRWLEPGSQQPAKPQEPIAPLPGFQAEPSLLDAQDPSNDPLAALDGRGLGRNDIDSPNFADPFFEQAKPLQSSQDHGEGHTGSQSLQMPNAIPDDWDRSIVSRPQRPPEPPAAPARPPEPPVAPPQQAATMAEDPLDRTLAGNEPAAAPSAPTPEPQAAPLQPREPVAADAPPAISPQEARTLAKALGLGDLPPAQQEQLIPLVAGMMRETVDGLMRALRARQTIKNEFRINMTMVEPQENNPLKFSISAEDALENLFVKSNRAYLPPIEATREAFADIADHQLALFSALRTAYDHLMQTFDPERLEARFDKQRGKSLLKGSGRHWDSYKSFYQDLGEDRDRAFRHLFAEEFAESYERIFGQMKAKRRQS